MNEAQKYNKKHIDFEEKQTERQHLLRVIWSKRLFTKESPCCEVSISNVWNETAKQTHISNFNFSLAQAENTFHKQLELKTYLEKKKTQ